MKVLKEFKVSLSDYLNYQQLQKARAAINLHYLGDAECNHYVDGRCIAKYPEKETQELKDAHFMVNMGFSVKVTI